MNSNAILTAKDRLIVALDTDNLDDACRTVDLLAEDVGMFKVGLQLFMHNGPMAFSKLKALGAKIFFDGKFMDIPNTVEQATRVSCEFGVDMLNVHALGGAKMIEAAKHGIDMAMSSQQTGSMNERPILLAVTILTSIDQQALWNEMGITSSLNDEVLLLSLIAKNNGAQGVVASAQEAAKIRKLCGEKFVIVTPGIRPANSPSNDQQRIVTPAQAIANGANYLVVGRPITTNNDPKSQSRKIVEEIETALST